MEAESRDLYIHIAVNFYRFYPFNVLLSSKINIVVQNKYEQQNWNSLNSLNNIRLRCHNNVKLCKRIFRWQADKQIGRLTEFCQQIWRMNLTSRTYR